MLSNEERARLVAAEVMDDENDTYPRICECCGSEFHGNELAAKRAGWKLGWDGWVCVQCEKGQ